MKKKSVQGAAEHKMFDDMGKLLDAPRGERMYENAPIVYNDPTLLVHQLAIFHKTDLKIYKLNVIDYPGERYECSGDRKSRWAHFDHAWLFNFTIPEEFEHYYKMYEDAYDRPMSREKMLDWLKVSRRNLTPITIQPSDDPVLKNSKRT